MPLDREVLRAHRRPEARGFIDGKYTAPGQGSDMEVFDADREVSDALGGKQALDGEVSDADGEVLSALRRDDGAD
jgi:hypothetical protein